jgi:hypothetical protein
LWLKFSCLVVDIDSGAQLADAWDVDVNKMDWLKTSWSQALLLIHDELYTLHSSDKSILLRHNPSVTRHGQEMGQEARSVFCSTCKSGVQMQSKSKVQSREQSNLPIVTCWFMSTEAVKTCVYLPSQLPTG